MLISNFVHMLNINNVNFFFCTSEYLKNFKVDIYKFVYTEFVQNVMNNIFQLQITLF